MTNGQGASRWECFLYRTCRSLSPIGSLPDHLATARALRYDGHGINENHTRRPACRSFDVRWMPPLRSTSRLCEQPPIQVQTGFTSASGRRNCTRNSFPVRTTRRCRPRSNPLRAARSPVETTLAHAVAARSTNNAADDRGHDHAHSPVRQDLSTGAKYRRSVRQRLFRLHPWRLLKSRNPCGVDFPAGRYRVARDVGPTGTSVPQSYSTGA